MPANSPLPPTPRALPSHSLVLNQTLTKPEEKGKGHKQGYGIGGGSLIGGCYEMGTPKIVSLVVCPLKTNAGVY